MSHGSLLDVIDLQGASALVVGATLLRLFEEGTAFTLARQAESRVCSAHNTQQSWLNNAHLILTAARTLHASWAHATAAGSLHGLR